MAAMIYRGNKPISVAVNILKSHPEHKTHYGVHVCSIHAEHRSVLKARTSVEGCTIYIARAGKHNNYTSKPCPACMEYLRIAGIKTMVFTVKGELVKEYLV
jgi:deoxycytidylate deaminase